MAKKESLEELSVRLHGRHDFLAESLLSPFVNQTNQNRGQMFSSHVGQAIQVEKSEPPLIFTGFENQVGKYSNGYRKINGKWMVIKKFQKNELNYTLIIQNVDTKAYDIIYRQEVGHLTEEFGYKVNNRTIDAMIEGDIFEDTIVYRDNNYDDEMNFQYGKNIRVAYIPFSGYTNEDALVLSKSMAEELASPFVEKVKVRINTNDIPLNLYGTKESYKSFPNIGEYVGEDGILMGVRRISYDEIINKFQDDQITKKIEGDTLKHVNRKARVMDINIWNNNEVDKMKNDPYNNQILTEYARNLDYYTRIHKFMKPIMENMDKEVSEELRNFYNEATAYRDPLTEYEDEGRRFDNVVIEFTISYLEPITVGGKVTARFGNKGIVGKIVEDDKLPTFTAIDGEPVREGTKVKLKADAVCNPFGVINRLNPSSLVCLELNYISTIIRYRMEAKETNEERYNILTEYLALVDHDQENLHTYQMIYEDMTEDERTVFLEDLISNGIYIKQEPFFRNINSIDLYNIYNALDIDLSPNNITLSKIAIGEMYYLRLKHHPLKQFSARGTGQLNLTSLPVKTRENKNHNARISSTPIRLGEMEVTNFGLVGSLDAINKLLDSYSNSSDDRNNLILSLLTGNPFDYELPEPSKTVGNNNIMFNSYMKALGIEFEENFDPTPIDRIRAELSKEDIILLGKTIEHFNVTGDELDIEDFISNIGDYYQRIAMTEDGIDITDEQ